MPEAALQAGVVVLVQLTRVSLKLTRFRGHLVTAGVITQALQRVRTSCRHFSCFRGCRTSPTRQQQDCETQIW